jgi:uncharacterized protein YjbJ (UPF0337 family)
MNSDSNDTSSIINFNEIQQNLAETFNPQTAKERTKEIFANLLLGMGVPFFLERLKEKLPEDVINKITELLKDPENLGKNSLEFAKQVFKDKFLEPIKNELLEKIADQVPELRGIDLTKASLGDIQKTITKGIIERMKAKLPPEIAENLPENFTRDDILNAVKRVGADKALEFAKNNLPPEAYAELERNQEILQNPERISDFVKGKLDDLQGQVQENFNNVKAQVQGRLDEVKQAIKGKIDEATTQARGKIDQLKQAQSDARKAWNDTKGEFNDRFKTAQGKLDEFRRNNPNANADDLKPFEDEVNNVKTAAENAKQSFFDGQDDLSTQIEDAQGQVEKITQNLIQKVGNVRATITQKAQEVAQRGQQQFEDTKAAAEQLQNDAATSTERVLAEPEVRAVSTGRVFQASEGGGETPSIFDRFSSFVGEKTTQFKQFIGKIGQQTPTITENGNIQYEPQMTMLQPDEPETAFSEGALRGVMQNPALATYYGTEITPADQLIDAANKTRILPYKAAERPVRGQRAPRPETQEPAPEQPVTPQDQLAPMREMMARQQQQATAEEPEPRPTAAQPPAPEPPAPVPEPPVPEPEVRPPVPEGGIGVGDVVGGAVEGAGIGMGIFQLEQGIANRNPAQEVGGGVPLGTTAVSTGIRQAQGQPAAPAEEEAPRPTTTQQQPPLGEEGEAPAPTAPSAPPAAEGGAGEGDVIGEQTGKALAKEGGVIAGEEGGEEGLFAGLIGGLSEVPILGTLVDIGGILGSIFGAKALMGGKAPPPTIVSGSSYEPNL